MNRTTAFSLAVLAALAGSLPARTQAADDETQFWLNGTAVVPLGDDWSGTFDVSRRFRDDDDQILLRGNADYRVSDRVSLGGGAAMVNSIDGLAETGNDLELRLHQQVTLRFGAFAFRTRLEERFLEDSDQMQLRVRQRVQTSLPVTRGLDASFSGELFFIARSHLDEGEERVSQLRFNGTLTHGLTERIDVAAGYLMLYTPRRAQPDTIAHVPQVTLTYRF